MITIPIEVLLKGGRSVYKTVILASRRATELSQGMPPLMKTSSTKASTIALEEIQNGLVEYRIKGKTGL